MPSSILSEANILAKLRHPGIPIVYDIEEDEAFYYIIEEYVEGESLEKLLWNTSVSQEYMIQIGIQLCGIVSFLHSQKPFPVLHQDLKPSHIIVCGNQVKLIDFGIASYITSRGKIIRTMEQKVLRHRSSTGNTNCIRQAIFMQSGLFFHFILRGIPTKAARHSGISHKKPQEKIQTSVTKTPGNYNRHWPVR